MKSDVSLGGLGYAKYFGLSLDVYRGHSLLQSCNAGLCLHGLSYGNMVLFVPSQYWQTSFKSFVKLKFLIARTKCTSFLK